MSFTLFFKATHKIQLQFILNFTESIKLTQTYQFTKSNTTENQ